MSTEPMVRGVNIVYTRKYILERDGSAVWEALVDSLPSDAAKQHWREIATMIREYPFSSFKAMIDAIAKKKGVSDADGSAELYYYMADQTLNLIYKIFFKLGSVSFVLSKYPQLWRRFFSFGALDVMEIVERRALLRFTVPEVAVDWVHSACFGFSKRAITLAGGSNVTQKETSRERLPSGEWQVLVQLGWDS
ncbi:MAG: hypothetical protein IT381_22200 [Deltaproteobacteria bacterium]|nr:hypothetical protein [Deltaproteobacteria bacterium]